jgi:hypothetical protein
VEKKKCETKKEMEGKKKKKGKRTEIVSRIGMSGTFKVQGREIVHHFLGSSAVDEFSFGEK